MSVCVGAVAVAAVMGAGVPAQAGGARPPVRYAGLDGCVCAPWKLWIRGGGVVALPGARVFSVGRQRAPLALSPNGRHVAYFQRRDGALVVLKVATGEVRAVPGVRWSNAMRAARVELSPGGRYAVLGVGGEHRILDTYSGEGIPVPLGLRPWSFSPDARFVLVVDDAFQAGIYSVSPFTERGHVPVGGALGPDGEIVAHFTARDAGIRLWDVPTGGIPRRDPIAVPADRTPTRMRWNGAGHLDLQTVVPRRIRKGGGTRYTWYRVDQEWGVTERMGGFVVPGSVHNPIVTGLTP
ncbi:hypothetical protein [Streptosporangium sp. NPDC002524]|uniref:hypothetical protein n=1 Tax=Streptosporangium sp. NPDC002524 TaxID=3154537 RepID=UPI003328033F